MARFYLTLHECGWVIDDHIGIESTDLAGAREAAVDALRDIVEDDLLTSNLCRLCEVEILDAERRHLEMVKFKDALPLAAPSHSAAPPIFPLKIGGAFKP